MAAASSQIVAFFSTNGGKRAPRHLKDPKPQVLCRSDRERDLKEYVRQLRESYPHVCSSIFSLSNNGKHFEPRWFFDEYDFHVQGGQFLYDVISAIIAENQEKLVRFCKEWSEANKKNHGVELLGDVRKTFDFYFHQKDQEELGNGFLASAVEYMREAYWNAKTEQSDELHEVKEPKDTLQVMSAFVPGMQDVLPMQQSDPQASGQATSGRFAPSHQFRTGPFAQDNSIPRPQPFVPPERMRFVVQPNYYSEAPPVNTFPGTGGPDVHRNAHFQSQIPRSASQLQAQIVQGGYGVSTSWNEGLSSVTNPHLQENLARGLPAGYPALNPYNPLQIEQEHPGNRGYQSQRQFSKTNRGRGNYQAVREKGNRRQSSSGQSNYGDRGPSYANAAEGGTWQNVIGSQIKRSSQEFTDPPFANIDNHHGGIAQYDPRRSSRASLSGIPRSMVSLPPYPSLQEAVEDLGAFENQIPMGNYGVRGPGPLLKFANGRPAIPVDCESWFELWVRVDDRISKDEFVVAVTEVTAIEGVRRDPCEDFASVRFHSTSDLAKVYNHPGIYCAGVRLHFQIPEFYLGPANTPVMAPRKPRRQSSNASRNVQSQTGFSEARPPLQNVQRRQSTTREGQLHEHNYSVQTGRVHNGPSAPLYSPQDARSNLVQPLDNFAQAIDGNFQTASITVPGTISDEPHEMLISSADSPRLAPVVEGVEDDIHRRTVEDAKLDGALLMDRATPISASPLYYTIAPSIAIANRAVQNESLPVFSAGNMTIETDTTTSMGASAVAENPGVASASAMKLQTDETPQTVSVLAGPKKNTQPLRTALTRRNQTPVIPALPLPTDRTGRRAWKESTGNVLTSLNTQVTQSRQPVEQNSSSSTQQIIAQNPVEDKKFTTDHETPTAVSTFTEATAPSISTLIASSSEITQRSSSPEPVIYQHDGQVSETASVTELVAHPIVHATQEVASTISPVADKVELPYSSRHLGESPEIITNLQNSSNAQPSSHKSKIKKKTKASLPTTGSASTTPKHLITLETLNTLEKQQAEDSQQEMTPPESVATERSAEVLSRVSENQSRSTIIVPTTAPSTSPMAPVPQDLSSWQKEFDRAELFLPKGTLTQQISWRAELDEIKRELFKTQGRVIEADQKLREGSVNANVRKNWNKKRRILVATHTQQVEQLTLLHARFVAERDALRATKTAAELAQDDSMASAEELRLTLVVVPKDSEHPPRVAATPDGFQDKVDDYYAKKKTYNGLWVLKPLVPTTPDISNPRILASLTDELLISPVTATETIVGCSDPPLALNSKGSSPSPLSEDEGSIAHAAQHESQAQNVEHVEHVTNANDVTVNPLGQTSARIGIVDKMAPDLDLLQAAGVVTTQTHQRVSSFPGLPNESNTTGSISENTRPASPTPSQLMSYAKVVKSKSPEIHAAMSDESTGKGKGRATSVGGRSAQDDKSEHEDENLTQTIRTPRGNEWKIGPEGSWGNRGLLGKKGG